MLKSRYPDKTRFYAWWLQNERLKTDKIPGAFAEVGVYKGKALRYFMHWILTGNFTCSILSPGFRLPTWKAKQEKQLPIHPIISWMHLPQISWINLIIRIKFIFKRDISPILPRDWKKNSLPLSTWMLTSTNQPRQRWNSSTPD